MFTVTGGTYAYLAFSASNNTISGITATADLDLVVERKLPSNVGVMVPQLEEYLGSAISDTYSCIDGNGNTVCQVYKATVTNKSTATVEVNGSIKFSGINNMPNLKWKRITDERTIGEYTRHIASTKDSYFEKNKVLQVGESMTYYFVVWIDETGDIQTDNGTFRVTIEFNPANEDGLTSTIVPTNYMKGFNAENDFSYFKENTYRNSIVVVAFVDYINTTNAVKTYDVSVKEDESIMAWLESVPSTAYYVLYIGSEETIYCLNLDWYFANLLAVQNIDFSNLDTSDTESMIGTFVATGSYNSNFVSLDLSSLDTSNVTNMGAMFYQTAYSSTNFTLDLGENFDTSNVTSMYRMFYNTGYSSTNFVLDLGGNFDTSNVTNMGEMFYQTAYSSTNFTLDLGNYFDTSNVMNMQSMFNSTGYSSTNFTLDLGNYFDTSNVTSMNGMFSHTGYNSTNFTLDLGNYFDTSNVVDMNGMFNSTGYSNTNFTLDLGNYFDTSKVKTMNYMFYRTGYNSTIFTLDLGNLFDTSEVNSMEGIFYFTGFYSPVFTLNLGDKFNTSNVTNMSHMFDATGQYSTIFTLNLGNYFDTSQVTDMSYMFCNIGFSINSFVLDISSFEFDNVTSFDEMFTGIKNTTTIKVGTTSAQTWILGLGYANLSTNNVIVV